MKFYMLILVTAAFLGGCDINESMRAKAKDGTVGEARAIAAKGGCMGCHAAYNSVYGPAWNLVGERYQDMPDAHSMLIAQIQNGSYGRWDDITGGRRMPPQKGALNDKELRTVVDYILSLAKK